MLESAIATLVLTAIIVAQYVALGIMLRKWQVKKGVTDEELTASYQRMREMAAAPECKGWRRLLQKYIIWNMNQAEKMFRGKWL